MGDAVLLTQCELLWCVSVKSTVCDMLAGAGAGRSDVSAVER